MNRGAQHSREAFEKAVTRCHDYYKYLSNCEHSIVFYFSSPEKWEKLLAHTDVFKNYNCEKFARQLTTYNGYMLISAFQLRNEYGENKLEDAILHALLNGIVYPIVRFVLSVRSNLFLLATKMAKESEIQRVKELRLAIAWNKFDYAENHILTGKTITSWLVM